MSTLGDNFTFEEHTLLYYLEDPALVLSRGGKIAYANPAFRNRFNLELSEILKRPLQEILPSWFREPVLDHLGCLRDKETSGQFRLGDNASCFQARIRSISRNGRDIGALLVLKEETWSEASSRGNLELFQTMLDDLLYPLSETRSYLSREGPLEESLKKSASNQLITLEEGISRMRSFGEIFFGMVRPERSPFYPGRILTMALKSLRPAAEQKKTSLMDGSSRELPMVLGAPGLLSRVLSLLVDYMIQEFRKGELVVVSADLIMDEKGASWLAYSISGTGIIRSDLALSGGESALLENFSALPEERKRMLLRVLLANKLVSAMGGATTVAAHESVGMTINASVPADIYYQPGG
ncbi:MAG: PAS domain-containing protein [bacterium]